MVTQGCVLIVNSDEKLSEPTLCASINEDEKSEGPRQQQQQHSRHIRKKNTLQESMRPLLVNMRLFGIYFEPSGVDDDTTETTSRDTSRRCLMFTTRKRTTPGVGCIPRNFDRLRSTVALVLLWSNVARCAMAFALSYPFNRLFIYKLTVTAIDCLCAILQTSYYVACRAGVLDSVLQRIQLTDKRAGIYFRLALTASISVWLIIIISAVLIAYVDYYSYYQPSFLLAPFPINWPVSNNRLAIIAALAAVRSCLMLPYFWFPVTMNQFITAGLYGEFRKLNQRFHKAIDGNGRFHDCIGQIRLRHQALIHAVENADRFIRIGNVGSFLCHMIVAIFLLYNVMFSTTMDSAIFYECVVCLVINNVVFTLATVDGIAINHAAHRINDIICDIDIATLSQSEINEMTLFQKRLSGTPIGFSVLGMFVISKRTVLSILGLVITYVLLVVQMSSPAKNSCNCALNVNASSTG